MRRFNKYLPLALAILFLPVIAYSVSAEEGGHMKHDMAKPKHDMQGMGEMEHKMSGLDSDMGDTRGMEGMKSQGDMQKQMDIRMGKMVYDMSCMYCHGSGGRGDGPAAVYIGPYSSPRPRDFYRGVFKFRTTESGNLPTEFDLMRTIRDGIPGYMPSFRYIGREKLRQVALYVSQFYKRKTDRKIKKRGKAYNEISIDHSVSFTMESIGRGQKIYLKQGCQKCHGMEGKGDGPSAKTLKDDNGFPIKPADLTRPSAFKNGNNHEDIYRTIITGLSGTPMPSFADAFRDDGAKAWDLVHYILSLSPDEEWTRMGRTR